MGLIGGGGSILAVPVLVYLFLLDETLATGYSLFVVGCSALVGGYKQYLKGHVDLKTAIIFGTPAILSVTLIRSFLMPIIPDELFNIGTLTISRRMGILGLFALVMIPAAMAMLKTSKPNQIKNHSKAQQNNYVIIIIEGMIIGAITGMVGAGGGFLIIPALVLLAKLDIKKAIGTSLVIVTLKSLTGFFLGDALTMTINWPFLLSFTSIAIVGIVVGTRLNSLINSSKLRKGFGYFILVMAAFILYMEFA